MWQTDALLDICRKYRDDAPAGVVFDEPYLPYVPSQWNGILVLAEAQNLSMPDKNEYVKRLRKMSSEGRMKRLPDSEGKYIGVNPWDDGHAKLALKAMIPNLELKRVAVSNAVPWSCVGDDGENKNPNEEMRKKASAFWRELFDRWEPELKKIIALGKVTRKVMSDAGMKDSVFALRLPSPMALRRLQNLFDREDLLARFPEARRAIETLGITATDTHVLFACHAVSLGGKEFKGLF